MKTFDNFDIFFLFIYLCIYLFLLFIYLLLIYLFVYFILFFFGGGVGGIIDKYSAQAWDLTGDKPLPKPMVTQLTEA